MRFMMLMIPKGYETAEPGTMPNMEDAFIQIVESARDNEAAHRHSTRGAA